MKRRHFISIVTAALVCAPTLLFADVGDAVVRQLRAQGYTSIEVSRTWLGRIQIEAKRSREEREIILNRKTGEILRDYSHMESDDDDDEHELLEHFEENGGSASEDGGDSENGDRGGGGNDDDDGDDDDDDDDDGDDDGDGGGGDGGEGSGGDDD